MSKKTTSSSSGSQNTNFTFDPDALSNYHSLINAIAPQITNFAQNPFGQQYQLEQTMAMNNASRLGQRGVSNVAGRFGAMGFGNMPGFQSAMLGSAERAGMSLSADAFKNSTLNALNRQQYAIGLGMSFQPLMKGSNSSYTGQSTQTTSGLGTWLPQLAGAGLSAFMGGMGAKTGGGGGGGGMGFQAGGAPSSQMGVTGAVPSSFGGGGMFGQSPNTWGGWNQGLNATSYGAH